MNTIQAVQEALEQPPDNLYIPEGWNDAVKAKAKRKPRKKHKKYAPRPWNYEKRAIPEVAERYVHGIPTGADFRSLRELMGITRKEMALKLGLPFHVLSYVEGKGSHCPVMQDVLLAVLKVYRTNVPVCPPK